MFSMPPMTRVVRGVLIALGVALLISVLGERLFGLPIFATLALSVRGGVHTLWQILTHPMAIPVSGSAVLQALLSGLFFYWMGVPLEQRIGSPRFAQLLSVMTLASGLCALLVGWLLRPWSSNLLVAYGMGPLLLGTLVALALSYPRTALLQPFGLFSVQRNALIAGFLGLTVLLHLADGQVAALFGDLGAAGAAALLMRRLRQAPVYRIRPASRTRAPQYWRGRKL